MQNSDTLPEIRIPAQPGVCMTGVVAQFSPVIMKTSMGGYMVMLPDKGVACHSTLQEVMRFLDAEAYPAMGEVHPSEVETEALPRVYQSWEDEEVLVPEPSTALRAPRSLQVVAGLIFLAASIFIAKVA